MDWVKSITFASQIEKQMQATYFRALLVAVLVGWMATLATPAEGKDFTVVLDAGHGGNDPGAIGKTAKEKNINLSVALAVGKLLKSNDPSINVVYTRRKDVFVTLQNRAQIANKCNADLFVSIHTNALPKGHNSTMGTETYTLGLHRTQENLEVSKRENSVILIEDDYKTRYAGFNPNSAESYIIFEFMQDKNMSQSVQLASMVQKQFRNTAKRVDRGVRQAGFLVLHATSMPSVLIELGYISTPAEEKYLTSQAGVNAMSRSISQAILNYKSAQKGNGKAIALKEPEPEPTPAADKKSAKQTAKADKADAQKDKTNSRTDLASNDTKTSSAAKTGGKPSTTTKIEPKFATTRKADAKSSAAGKAEPKTSSAGKAEPKNNAAAKTEPKSNATAKAEPKTSTAGKSESKAEPKVSVAGKAEPENNATGKAEPRNNAPAKADAKPASTAEQGEIVFKVQIMAAGRQLKTNDPQLKGVSPISFYKEKGLYKYTYGESTDYQQIQQERKKMAAKFKGAFVVAFRDGVKMDINEALRIYNSKKQK